MESRNKKGHFVKGHKIHLGKKYSENHRRNLSKGHLGVSNGPHKEETKRKMSLASKGKKKSEEHRRKLSIVNKGKYAGDKHWNWQGGITDRTNNKYNYLRKTVEYKLWRQAVFERDNYTCVWCGSNERLEADHIKAFSQYPELRFSIDNGRTLCRECHKKTDNYGTNCRSNKNGK